MYIYVYMYICVYILFRDQRITCEILFSPTIMLILQIKVRSSGLVTSLLT